MNQVKSGGGGSETQSRQTKTRILDAARAEFMTNGLKGTRMEGVAATAGVNKSLIYRHFGNRETLYREVLKRTYQAVREAEAQLALPRDPLDALDAMAEFTLRYYLANPDFLALVGIENLNKGAHLSQIDPKEIMVSSLVDKLRTIIAEGEARHQFRAGLTPSSIFMVLAGLSWFTVATAHTFSITFGETLLDEPQISERLGEIREATRRFVLA